MGDSLALSGSRTVVCGSLPRSFRLREASIALGGPRHRTRRRNGKKGKTSANFKKGLSSKKITDALR